MTRDELVAALKARKVSEAAFAAAMHSRYPTGRSLPRDRYEDERATEFIAAAQAANAERLAEALDVALYTFFEAREDGAKYIPAQEAAWGAFAASLTGPTT